MSNIERFALWSVDWEDNQECFECNGRFVQSSRELRELFEELIGGAVTWYAKIDFLSDITDHDGLDRLAEDILSNGGEVGLHMHHVSWEPYYRMRAYKRAVRVLRERLNIIPTSYSSGNGNYIT